MKSVQICNNSKIAHPQLTRFSVKVPNYWSYKSESSRMRALEVRAYYQYNFIKESGGHMYFPTLTYNDNCLPDYHGISCFDTSDIQGFFKRLRNYFLPNQISYLVTKEFGSKNHRPHYHVLLGVLGDYSEKYVLDAVNKSWHDCVSVDYESSTPQSRGLKAKKYIRGGSVNISPYGFEIKDVETANGKSYSNAITYVAKYMMKDTFARKVYDDVHRVNHQLYSSEHDKYIIHEIQYYIRNYERMFLQNLYNLLNYHPAPYFDMDNLETRDKFIDLKELDYDFSDFSVDDYDYYRPIHKCLSTFSDFKVSCNEFKTNYIKALDVHFHNHFGIKPQMSNGFGLSAVNAVDKDMKVPFFSNSKGMIKLSAPLYVFRKYFYDVVNVDGCPRYQVKMHKRHELAELKMKSLANEHKNLVKIIDYVQSNSPLWLSNGQINALLNLTPSELNSIALYRQIYQDRYYKRDESLSINLSPLDDIFTFTNPLYHDVDYIEEKINDPIFESRSILKFIKDESNYIPYSKHPRFSNIIHLIDLFEIVENHLFDFDDIEARVKWNEKSNFLKLTKK